MKQKFIYEEDKDYKDYFVDDIISTNINQNARIVFMDTTAIMPTEGSIDDNKKVTLIQDHEDNCYLKKYKAGIILPINMIPMFIENLEVTYNNYLNMKKDEE